MLTLDPALFPKLNTRKALVIVDAQNDFLSPDGALPVTLPSNLVGHISDLVTAFRPYGDVIWVRSVFEDNRDPEDESILTSEAPMVGGRRAVARGRRPQANPHDQPSSDCPEAFLTLGGHDRPACVRTGTSGAELPDALKEIVEKKDISFAKSHYSAFQSEELLQRLRMKFVTEIFLCGSMTNIGIQASAVDAASHGLDITIVEDCCGRRSSMRHNNSLKQIMKTTGCEVVSAKEVAEKLKPKEVAAKKESQAAPRIPRRPAPAPASMLSSFANASIDDVLPAEDKSNQVHPPNGSFSATTSRLSPNAKAEESKPEAIGVDDPRDATSEEERGMVQAQAATRGLSKDKTLEDAMSSLTMGNTKETNGVVSVKVQRKCPEDLYKSAPQVNDKTEKVENGDKSPPTNTQAKVSPHAMKDLATQGSPDAGEAEQSQRENESSVSDPYGEGDTRIHYNVLPDDLVAGIFDKLRDEVQWLRMSHQGGEVPRLVAVQGHVGDDGEFPIYRHPADESPPLLPWTSTVREIKDAVEQKVGHPLNHALIQFYRDGNDYISEHSDKTLDIAKGSYIVNVSLGAERTMIFRTKRQPKDKDTMAALSEPSGSGTKRTAQRAQLPHNSMCQMGLQTNMRWLHAIRQDKRLDREKTPEELAFGGARISLTFRKIGTFLDSGSKQIWGQGATGKTREQARPVTNGATPEAVKMLQAFGRENQGSEFDWEAHYGGGFDVLNISASPRLFTSSDAVANLRVQVMLAEYGIGYAKGSLAPVSTVKDAAPTQAVGDEEDKKDGQPIRLVDNDEAKSTVEGDLAIMLYVTQRRGFGNPEPLVFTRFQQALNLLPRVRRASSSAAALHRQLDIWETYAAESEFMAASCMTLADFAFWPVLHDVKQACAKDGGNTDPLKKFTKLEAYYQRVKERESVQKALGAPVPRAQKNES